MDIVDDMRRLILFLAGSLLFSTDLSTHADVVFKALAAGFSWVATKRRPPR